MEGNFFQPVFGLVVATTAKFMDIYTSKSYHSKQIYLLILLAANNMQLGIQTRAARGFAIPSSCGGLGSFGAWPPVAAITDQVARFARHFLSAEQPKMNALKL